MTWHVTNQAKLNGFDWCVVLIVTIASSVLRLMGQLNRNRRVGQLVWTWGLNTSWPIPMATQKHRPNFTVGLNTS
jgi:hypothetical protein